MCLRRDFILRTNMRDDVVRSVYSYRQQQSNAFHKVAGTHDEMALSLSVQPIVVSFSDGALSHFWTSIPTFPYWDLVIFSISPRYKHRFCPISR